MDEFMSKPIRKKVLIEKLSKMLANHPVIGSVEIGMPDVAAPTLVPNDLPLALPVETSMPDVAPVIDRFAFEELVVAIGIDGVRATLDVYVAETSLRLATLRALSCDSDRERIKDEAHTLKGASGTFGLRQVSELAWTLEQSAPTLTSDEFFDLVDRLDASFKLARDEAERAYVAAAA